MDDILLDNYQQQMDDNYHRISIVSNDNISSMVEDLYASFRDLNRI